MQNYNAEKVVVTLSLTAEAADVLRQYAGERNRGRFLSDLIMAQRRRDEAEASIAATEAKRQATERAAERAVNARSKFNIPTPSQKRKKGR